MAYVHNASVACNKVKPGTTLFEYVQWSNYITAPWYICAINNWFPILMTLNLCWGHMISPKIFLFGISCDNRMKCWVYELYMTFDKAGGACAVSSAAIEPTWCCVCLSPDIRLVCVCVSNDLQHICRNIDRSVAYSISQEYKHKGHPYGQYGIPQQKTGVALLLEKSTTILLRL